MSRTRTIVAIILALSVLVILVSPCAASQLTTLRSPQKVRPPMAVLHFAPDLANRTWISSPLGGVTAGPSLLVLPGSEVVALVCARLC